MADFQNLQVPLGKLDTKSDEKAMPPGGLTMAENATTQVDGIYKKRFGMTALSGAVASCVRLTPHKQELVFLGEGTLYRYNPIRSDWSSSGTAFNGVITAQHTVILDQTVDIDRSTSALSTNGMRVDVWIDATNNFVYLRMTVEATGSIVYTTTLNAAGAWQHVHAATLGTHVLVTYSSTALQKVNSTLVDCVAITTGLSTNLQAGANVSATWAVHDMIAISATDVIIAWASNTPNVRVWRINGLTGATVAGPTVVAAETASAGGLAVLATEGEAGYLAYYSVPAGGIRAAIFDPGDTSQTVAPFAVEVSVASANFNITLARQDATSVRIFWDRANVTPAKPFTKWTSITNAGTLFFAASTLQNAMLASKAYVYRLSIYVNVADSQATSLATVFTIETFLDGGLAGGIPMLPAATHGYRSIVPILNNIKGQLSDVVALSATAFRFNCARAYKFLSSSGTTFRATIEGFDSDFGSSARLLPIEVNDSLLIANGVPSKYDGRLASEANFLVYPEITRATVTAAAGMDNGVRSYIAVYETTDVQGDTARSTTSLPFSANATNGAANNTVTLKVTQLCMTRLVNQGQTAVISIFRTAAAGTIYYWLGQITVDTTVSVATFVDTAQDVTITTQRQLYTGGGVVDREPPPPALQFVLHTGRVWGIPSADRRTVVYSGDVTPGEDVWFSSLQSFRVEPGGDITALASMDDKLVIFKADRIFKVTGRGLNQLGQANDLTLPALISSDCGCIDPRSVIATPDGIMFQSNKGIYLLARSEQVDYIGAPVDDFTTDYRTCTSAVMVPDRREVRFTMTGAVSPLVAPAGVTLIYNYRDDAWTHWSLVGGIEAQSSAVVSGIWYWGTSSGTVVYKEDPTAFLDAGSLYVSMTLETGWIAPAGQQGLARVQWCGLLADLQSDCGIELQIAKDYVNAYVMDWTFPRSTLNSLPLAQVFGHLSQQQGEAYRVRVSDYADGGTPGEGYAASGVVLTATPKRGTFEKLIQATAKG